ncbi:MAG: hypothetical protein M3O22_06005 [Pseudomonadota bacterium]|nr:hypothetical protein [Pseudomonadota bacterium]
MTGREKARETFGNARRIVRGLRPEAWASLYESLVSAYTAADGKFRTVVGPFVDEMVYDFMESWRNGHNKLDSTLPPERLEGAMAILLLDPVHGRDACNGMQQYLRDRTVKDRIYDLERAHGREPDVVLRFYNKAANWLERKQHDAERKLVADLPGVLAKKDPHALANWMEKYISQPYWRSGIREGTDLAQQVASHLKDAGFKKLRPETQHDTNPDTAAARMVSDLLDFMGDQKLTPEGRGWLRRRVDDFEKRFSDPSVSASAPTGRRPGPATMGTA